MYSLLFLRLMVLKLWCLDQQHLSAPPGNYYVCKFLGPNQYLLGVEPSNLYLKSPLGDSVPLKFENRCLSSSEMTPALSDVVGYPLLLSPPLKVWFLCFANEAVYECVEKSEVSLSLIENKPQS